MLVWHNIFQRMELRRNKKYHQHLETNFEQIEKNIVFRSKIEEKLAHVESVFRELDLEQIHQVWAVGGDYAKSGLRDILSYIQQWELTKFYLWSNKNPRMLKNIENINFPALKELHLGYNNIESIEPLSRMQMPELRQLVLRDNKITSVEGVKKCDFKKLRVLNLRGNKIRSFNFEQWNFQNLENLNINGYIAVDIRSIMKISSSNIKNLRALQEKTLFSINHPINFLTQSKLKFNKTKMLVI